MSSYDSSDPTEELRRSVRATFQGEIPQKSLFIAYVLWFFFGGFGGHRFYLGRPVSGAILALVNIGNIAVAAKSLIAIMNEGTGNATHSRADIVGGLLQGGLGIILGATFLIWMLVDLFLIPGMRRAFQRKYQESLA